MDPEEENIEDELTKAAPEQEPKQKAAK